MPEFRLLLAALDDVTWAWRGEGVLVGGDFNCRPHEWSLPHPDSRGKQILEIVAIRGLVLLNTTSSIPDVTFHWSAGGASSGRLLRK